MNRYVSALLTLPAILIVGCANEAAKKPADAVVPSTVITMSDAVDDYIKVAELKEVPAVRSLEQIHHKVISDRYILIYDQRRRWLAGYARPCRELFESDVTPDIRYERNTVRARFDTYRGCKVDRIYQISRGVADEIMSLGDAPGQK